MLYTNKIMEKYVILSYNLYKYIYRGEGNMADICSCCGKKIPFLDAGFDMFEIGEEDYKICSSCNGNFSAFKRGNISFEELVTDSTNPKLKEYFKQFAPGDTIVQEAKQQELKLHNKLVAQENDPLYDDIHQIAGDLRFIKNLIIFGIVCGVILGLICMFGIM